MYDVSVTNLEEPYSAVISQFLRAQFPSASRTPSDLLDDLTAAFVVSGQVRFGPVPSPESLVAIRKVLARSIKAGTPIPVLMPWGSRKPNAANLLDVAEVAGLKSLSCLQQRVTQVFKPGLDLRIRVEDLSGFWLFQDEGEVVRAQSERYVRDFQALVRILELPFITPVLESVMMNEEIYFAEARRMEALFDTYLWESEQVPPVLWPELPSFKALLPWGWTGEIPRAQRDFYYSRYDRFTPGLQLREKVAELARYFAGTLVRRGFKANGDPAEWEKQFIKLSFHPPVPGTPTHLVETALYYRTIPAKFASTHLPPWRARGYLRMEEGEVVPKLTSISEKIDLHDCRVRLAAGDDVVLIDTPYSL